MKIAVSKILLASLLVGNFVAMTPYTSYASDNVIEKNYVYDNVVYIDAMLLSEEELVVMCNEAQNGTDTVIISWGDATATFKPIEETAIEPCFNEDDTYKLTTTTWKYIDKHFVSYQNNLKITNKTGNPGAVDIKLKTNKMLNNETTKLELKAGYYTTFKLAMAETYELWLKANKAVGDYHVVSKISF